MFDFETAWLATWSRLGLEGRLSNFENLIASYSEQHRHYHGLQHLRECLELYREISDLADHSPEVEVAIWFHDAIYEPLRHDNELRSANWANDALLAAGAESGLAKRVHSLIMATQHTATPKVGNAELLLDIDLAILGAAPERFSEYQEQIRAEYAHVPDIMFRQKRREVLLSFFNRPQIYNTPILRERFEAAARANLAAAII